jgi:precorrin-6B methylase 2
MTRPRPYARILILLFASTLAGVAALQAQTAPGKYEPKVGQAGKDVVWVPTPAEMVDRMLDLAKVTSSDLVVDLGSGDGRNVIAAARRGARALGVEYNPDLVELSRRHAEEAGVSDRATFVQGDMYEADFSDATVLALFLLPENLRKLMPKFVELKPGTRIVANTFGLSGWTPDATTEREEGCRSWCEAMLYIVPARVQGTWRLEEGSLELQQEYQKISGAITIGSATVPIENAAVRGDAISFVAGGATYNGRVKGDRIDGAVKSGNREHPFIATRQTK